MTDFNDFNNIQNSKKALADQVADLIIELIQKQHLNADDQIPNEYELAKLLNVSRSSIREAIKILTARNILVIKRGRGTFISQTPGMTEDPLGLSFHPDKLQLARDLFELRLAIEPWVAYTAAQRATDEDIHNLDEKCTIVENKIHSKENQLPADCDFHTCIAYGTHNIVVPKIIPIITSSVGLFSEINGRSLLTETVIGHRNIFHAIASHNPDEAKTAMIKHLQQNKQSLDSIIQCK